MLNIPAIFKTKYARVSQFAGFLHTTMYESFYHLKEAPFQLSPDPRYFFCSSVHRRVLVNLRHSLQHFESFVVVTGRSGLGKTELMSCFAKEVDTVFDNVANISLSKLRGHNILEFVAGAFNIVSMGLVGDALMRKVERDLVERAERKERFIVLIDNAHILSDYAIEKLAYLCSVKVKGKPVIQAFLFGETTILPKLMKLPLDLSSFQLDPIPRSEIQPYIEYRLLQAGWQGSPNFHLRACEVIHEITRGIPWRINMLCHRLLMQACLDDLHEITEQQVIRFQVLEFERRTEYDDDNRYFVNDIAETVQQHAVDDEKEVIEEESDDTTRLVVINGETSCVDKGKETVGKATSVYTSSPEKSAVKVSAFKSQPAQAPQASNLYRLDSAKKANAAAVNSIADTQNRRSAYMAREIEFDDTERLQGDIPGPLDIEFSDYDATDDYVPTLSEQVTAPGQTTAEVELSNSEDHEAQYPGETQQEGPIFPPRSLPPEYEGPGGAEPESQDEFHVLKEQWGDPDEYYETVKPVYGSDKTPMQIASRASIVTSLVITLIMWITNDTKITGITHVQSSMQNTLASHGMNRAALNDVTPSPFVNPDEAALKKRQSSVIVKN